MSQSRRASAAEAVANIVAGCAINWTILYAVFDEPVAATAISLVMIPVSSLRLYVIRRVFNAR